MEYKDAVLVRDCDRLYPESPAARMACEKVLAEPDAYFVALEGCPAENPSDDCLEDSRYSHSCSGIFKEPLEEPVYWETLSIFDYCEEIVYADYIERIFRLATGSSGNVKRSASHVAGSITTMQARRSFMVVCACLKMAGRLVHGRGQG